MHTYTATYSPEDNKLRLYAVGRLDPDTYARVKAAGFIWAAKQALWVAPMWTPARADLLIELAGEIGDEDTSLVDRAEDRADRFDTYRAHRTHDAECAHAAVAAIADGIPLGQPILVGHHSERHARRDAAKIENGMRRTIKMWETAKYWQARAAGAVRHAKYKELPRVRANRIKGLEADARRHARILTEARDGITLWGRLRAVGKDGRPCDLALQQRRALVLSSTGHYGLPNNDPRGGSVWSALERGTMSPREAQIQALRQLGRTIRHARRWAAHIAHRLVYERAMLEAQGATTLLAPKPKSAAAQLPLCNYRAPDGLEIANIYHRHETIHYPQIEMTKAEYAAIHTDYKATRVKDHSHRVRTTMQRHALVCVFLTDLKVTPAPTPREAPARTVPERSRVTDRPDSVPVPSLTTTVEALRESLNRGITVVATPQLFPTPTPIARQVIELAEIRPGDRVLEPSAGTGALVEAIGLNRGIPPVVAVEVHASLAEGLRARYPVLASVRCADFLACNGDLGGPFDRIVMNPPFDHGSDIRHIQHARRFLAPGGRLVAICADGPRQRATFQAEAEAWISLPAGTFTGTNVQAAIVVLVADDPPNR